MAITLSEYLNISEDLLEKVGIFNRFLDYDANYFINIKRLKVTKIEAFEAGYEKINERFRIIALLLIKSTRENDRHYQEAVKKFNFHEVNGIGLGYAKGSFGSGFGKKLSKKVISDAKEIIDSGITDPEIFHLIGLFEDNIGADRISDMFASIIEEEIKKYTLQMYIKLNITQQKYNTLEFENGFLINPHNNHPVLLLPLDIIHELPVVDVWEDIEVATLQTQAIRNEMNEIIGDNFKDATISQKKKVMFNILTHNTRVSKELIDEYKNLELNPYDFSKDPKGEYKIIIDGKRIAQSHPMCIESKRSQTTEIAKEICNQFKHLIENNKLADVFYDDDKKPRKEKTAQLLFQSIAHSYCLANNIDMSPEANSGRGPVDFKFSSGYSDKTLVEIKLTTNSQLCHGIEKQLFAYGEAEQTLNLIYLVIDTGGPEKRIEKMNNIFNNFERDKINLELIFIDAIPKLSASRY